MHEVSFLKNCGRPQEAVSRDQFHRSVCLSQQGAENPGKGALANGYATGHRNHEGTHPIGFHLNIKESAKRSNHLLHLRYMHRLIDALEGSQQGRGESVVSRIESCPLLSTE